MKLKKAIAEYLLTQSSIHAVVEDRIYRKKAPADVQTPCIVYDTSGYQNRLGKYQKDHGYQWNKLTIDVIGTYEQDDLLQDIAGEIVSLLWWFIGELTSDRSWTIALEWADEWYDPETGYSIARLFFLCKHTF